MDLLHGTLCTRCAKAKRVHIKIQSGQQFTYQQAMAWPILVPLINRPDSFSELDVRMTLTYLSTIYRHQRRLNPIQANYIYKQALTATHQ